MTRDEAESALSYLASNELIELKESDILVGEKIRYYITEKGEAIF